MFQFGGQSSKGLPLGGEWRCMSIDEITQVTVIDGPWHSQNSHIKPQTCIDQVEYEVIA
ncbi:hypothetical protein [Novosphingobium sp. FSW06-99]|uniref:hypothetical protein n=1 Tax=Novosphingobium sp. FSW06-99 TaxID=1739113 RepID=UPI0018D23B3E|nr:hypothetical protein [Novosphingobium sp. FSW06-99]